MTNSKSPTEQTTRETAESRLSAITSEKILKSLHANEHAIAIFTNSFKEIVYQSEIANSAKKSPSHKMQANQIARRLYGELLTMPISRYLPSCREGLKYLEEKYANLK